MEARVMENFTEDSIKENLRKIIAKKLKIKPDGINDNAHVGNDLGIDSADMINVLYDIEDAFSIKMSDDEASDNLTIKSLANLVKAKIDLKNK